MGVVYVPVVAVLSAVFLGLFASIMVGVGISTNRFARRFWRDTKWKRVKRRMRFAAGFIAVCVLSVPVLPFLLMSMVGEALIAIADYACSGRAWTNKIADWMDEIGVWVTRGDAVSALCRDAADLIGDG